MLPLNPMSGAPSGAEVARIAGVRLAKPLLTRERISWVRRIAAIAMLLPARSKCFGAATVERVTISHTIWGEGSEKAARGGWSFP